MKYEKGKSKTGGRKAGTLNKSTREIKGIAGQHGEVVIAVLAKIVEDNTAPHAARIAAGRELLDRGYGKAREIVDVTAEVSGPKKQTVEEAKAVLEAFGLRTRIFDPDDDEQ